jgi:hypothetical protein
VGVVGYGAGRCGRLANEVLPGLFGVLRGAESTVADALTAEPDREVPGTVTGIGHRWDLEHRQPTWARIMVVSSGMPWIAPVTRNTSPPRLPTSSR